MTLSPRAIEVGARALCIAAGDDPDKMTYAHEMACTGRDREPKYRWQYWAEFAEAAICAALAAEGLVLAPKEPTPQQIAVALPTDSRASVDEAAKRIGAAAVMQLLGGKSIPSEGELVMQAAYLVQDYRAMLQAAQGGNDA